MVDDRVYVGGQQDFGYFDIDAKGALSYRSLKPEIPAGETDFTDVWRVVHYGADVFFQSNKRIFRLHDGHITAYKSINWSFLATARGLLIAQQYEHGMMVFKDTGWVQLSPRPEFSHDRIGIRALTTFGSHGILMASQRLGFYLYDKDSLRKLESPTLSMLSSQFVHVICAVDTEQIIVGTRLDGYYVINTKSEILQHVTKKEGLQSNTINAIMVDGEKNFWLGLNNGIDLVIYNSAINHITPSSENRSPGYSAAIHDNKLFIGTGYGLFSMPLRPDNDLSGMQQDFSLVKGSNGIVWGLSVVNNQLLMGKNDGAFIVAGNACTALDSSNGFWFFQPLSGQQPAPRIIAGTYSGVNVYNYVNGKFVNPKIHAFFESAKYTVVSGDDIWVVHPYQGLYKITFNDTGAPVSHPYIDKKGILSSGHNHLYKIQNKIVLVTRVGIFEYDQGLKDFKESEFFKRLLGSKSVSYLREDTQGNIWFIENKRPGVIDLSHPESPVITYFSELNNSVLGNDEEFIYPINKNNILIAGEVGFYHINYEKYRATNRPLRILLRNVTAFHERDSVLFGGYLFRKDSSQLYDSYKFASSIRYKWNSLHFEYSSPYFGEFVEYSCRLSGYEQEWSAWSKRTERSYTNLPAGNYVFEVLARNSNGQQSAVTRFEFSISPPWYNTIVAYVIYVVLSIAIMYFFYKRQQQKYIQQHTDRLRKQREKFDEEQKRLQYQHQLEIEKSEKEIMRLKNVQLQTEVEHNNVELASNTMNLLQKRELMNKIKDEILKLQEEEEPERRAKNVRRIIKIINEQLEMNDDWERFSQYFDKSNNDFLKTLREGYPLLTPSDLKLCAYLRLNLSTKAIADLLNLSIRGVESSRYRLRKKLSIENEVSLSEFLSNISP
ncbi:MAG: hypothetical protein JST68_21570 [Bacteroidetes bacterium]|nr:hypothetical protein [Bacteroidota bacterium]